MIEYKVGDIFTEDVEALVNSVNCVGVMGRGIALQVSRTSSPKTSRPMPTPASGMRFSLAACLFSTPGGEWVRLAT